MKKLTAVQGSCQLSRGQMRAFTGGRTTCFNIPNPNFCGSTPGCWLQSLTRCCCSEI